MIVESSNLNVSLNKNQNISNNKHNISNISNFSIFNLNANGLDRNINSNYKVQSNPPKNIRNNIKIRNLTHFYDKIESHQETYELLFLLK